MKKIVAVIGDANIDDDPTKQTLAFETGRLLIESGYILASGGFGGVMEHASRGAKSASNYTQGSIIGVLPQYDTRDANPHLDIAIPSGMGLARNVLLVSMASAVIVIGGGSGTLSEVALAWQMRKLIVATKTSGWSGKLIGQQLDERRRDHIIGADDARAAVEAVNHHIAQFINTPFGGVKQARISRTAAKELIESNSDDGVHGQIEYLGKGSEGLVFQDSKSIYKVIDNSSNPLERHWQLAALFERMKKAAPLKHIQNIRSVKLCGQKYILVQSPRIDSREFDSVPDTSVAEYIQLLREFKRLGWVSTDLQPKNLRVLPDGALMLADIGHSLFPFSQYMFESMCRRAFVTHKLQGKLRNYPDFKPYLTAVNEGADFAPMVRLGFDAQELKEQFDEFYQKIVTVTKEDILNPVLEELFRNSITAKTVLDYGSGHGDHARMLTNLNKEVTAFEPDEEVVSKYRERNYTGVRVVNRDTLMEMKGSKVTFDTVLCSLVFCYSLGKSEQEQFEEAERIMGNLVTLSRTSIVMVICNPLYAGQPNSQLHQRQVPQDFNYLKASRYTKKLFSTGRETLHSHCPLSYYEDLFRKYRLRVRQIVQTNDTEQPVENQNSDFMIFILDKG